jgi:transposase
MTNQTYLPKEYDVFIGIDVDKKSYSFTAYDHSIMNRSKKIPSNPEYLYNYIQNQFGQERVICAYEAGPTGFGLYDYLKSRQVPCLVISPLAIKKACNERVKNNRIDSKQIAQQLKNGEFSSIRVPEGAYREFRHLARTRELYTDNRKRTKQRIKSLLLQESLYSQFVEPRLEWSSNHLKKLKNIKCSCAVRNRLDMLLLDLDYNRRQILSVHRILKAFLKEHKGISEYISYIRSIPGIGPVTAMTILANIGNPENLKNPEEIGAFAGLTPTENSTGDIVRRGGITHFGNQTLRRLLIEAAWTAIRYDTELQQFYYRLKMRNAGSGGPQKAITAVARKLTKRIYRVLKEQRAYILR